MPNTAEYNGIEIRQALDHIYADREGNVYSLKGSNWRLLKPCLNKAGYYTIKIFYGSTFKTKRVHRLIATAWIENPNNKPEINHKNGVKMDNRVEIFVRERSVYALEDEWGTKIAAKQSLRAADIFFEQLNK